MAIFGADGERARSRSGSSGRTSRRSTPPMSRCRVAGEVVINPGDRHLHVKRVIALPELYGPSVRGIPLGEHGFIRVDPYGRVRGRGGRLRGRRRDRLPDQARRRRLTTGRRGSAVDRSAGRSERRARAVQPRDPRDAADGRRADVPDGEDHRRARIQLGDLGHADLAFADTRSPRSISRRTWISSTATREPAR